MTTPAPQAEENEGAPRPGSQEWRDRQDEADARWLAAGAGAEDAPPGAGDWHPGLEIRDEGELGAALAWLRNLRHEANEVLRRRDQEVERVNDWAAPRISKLEDSAAHLEVRILAYAKEHPEVFPPGKKTARFPSGRLQRRERKEGTYRFDPSLPTSAARAALKAWAIQEQASGRPDSRAGPLVVPGEVMVDLERVKEYLETISTRPEGAGGVGFRTTAPGLEYLPPGETLEVKTDG